MCTQLQAFEFNITFIQAILHRRTKTQPYGVSVIGSGDFSRLWTDFDAIFLTYLNT